MLKLLITGGCGFIGSNFVLKHAKSGKNTVLNIDKLTYAGNIENLNSIKDRSNYQFIECDISDKTIIMDAIFSFQPDLIVHFAAESHVDRSIDRPMDFIQTNLVGTATLLSAAFQYWHKISDKEQSARFRFLHVSTDEVFGSLGDAGFFNETEVKGAR